MKVAKFIILWIFMLLFTKTLSAQVFAPLQHDTKALYTTWPDKGPTSSLVITDTTQVENRTVFNTFKTWHINNSQPNIPGLLPDMDCEQSFWSTGGECYPANIPFWFGSSIVKESAYAYKFFTVFGDTLRFNFDLNQGDSTLIYAAGEDSIMMVYQYSDTATFLNYNDSVAKYRLIHFHPSGSVVNSPLHDSPVTVGKNLGLIHFFRIDSFPQTLQPIEIAGHTGTQSGLYAIKPKDIYDFNEGDIFQYKNLQSSYAPGTGYTEYNTVTVLSRTETETSIEYSLSEERIKFQNTGEFINGLWVASIDTIFSSATVPLSVSKNEVMAQLPFEAHDVDSEYVFRNLHFVDENCGMNWQFSVLGSFWYQCNSDSVLCYGNTAHFAPGEGYSIPGPHIYQQGSGTIGSLSGWEIVSGPSNSLWSSLQFSIKNGVECGNQWVLSTGPAVMRSKDLKLYPNPTTSVLHLQVSATLLVRATLYDIQGREVLDIMLNEEKPTLNISSLNKGMYLIKVIDLAGKVYLEKLILQ